MPSTIEIGREQLDGVANMMNPGMFRPFQMAKSNARTIQFWTKYNS